MIRRRPLLVGVTNWDPRDDNPYLARSADALSALGVALARTRLAPLAIVWLFARGGRAMHVHWPEYLVRPVTASRLDVGLNFVRLLRVALGLATCRLLRVRIVWTVHNLSPHDRDASWAAREAYGLIAHTADVFVAHSHAAAARTRARYPRAEGRLVVVPHGHYIGAHPAATTPRAELRARLGVPENAFLLLAFGQVRRYKQLAGLTRMVAEADRTDLHLLIAGAPSGDALADELEHARGGSGRVHLDLRRIPGDAVADLYGACDAAVVNHDELFSSGTLLLGLSQGIPVITAESDAARELAGWPAVSTFRDGRGLAAAVDRLAAVDPATRRAAALDAAVAASWEIVAMGLRDAYGRL